MFIIIKIIVQIQSLIKTQTSDILTGDVCFIKFNWTFAG